jgi:hypothetical protein
MYTTLLEVSNEQRRLPTLSLVSLLPQPKNLQGPVARPDGVPRSRPRVGMSTHSPSALPATHKRSEYNRSQKSLPITRESVEI